MGVSCKAAIEAAKCIKTVNSEQYVIARGAGLNSE